MEPAVKRSRTRREPEVRKEAILEEAIRIVGERGYNGFSIQELALRCGLTNGGLLYHFGSKEQLLIALLQDRDSRDREVVRSMAGLAPDGKPQPEVTLETVFKLFRAMVKRNSQQPELVRLYTVLRSEALNPGHPAHPYFTNRDAATLKSFAQMVAPYVSHAGSSARQILALMCGLEEQWLRSGQHFNLVAEWDRGIALLLPGPGPGKRPRRKQSGR
jgi:AcrR family transcriptional regulator